MENECVDDVPVWEACKENVLPLKRGRSVRGLSHALTTHEADKLSQLGEFSLIYIKESFYTSTIKIETSRDILLSALPLWVHDACPSLTCRPYDVCLSQFSTSWKFYLLLTWKRCQVFIVYSEHQEMKFEQQLIIRRRDGNDGKVGLLEVYLQYFKWARDAFPSGSDKDLKILEVKGNYCRVNDSGRWLCML